MNRRFLIIILLLLLSLFLAAKGIVINPARAPGIDYYKHYYAARHVVEGKTPYRGDGLFLAFNYPQFVAWLNLPLALFPSAEAAEPAWDIMNALLVVISALIIMFGYRPAHYEALKNDRSVTKYDLPWWILSLFAFFFYHPTIAGLRQGNVSSWDLFFITVAGWAVIKNKDYAAGVFIALSSLIKLLPALLIIPFIFGRRKKVIIGAVSAWGIYFLALLVTRTLDNEWFYFTGVIPKIGTKWAHVSYSIPHVMFRHLFPSLYTNPDITEGLSALWSVIIAGTFAGICFKARRLWHDHNNDILIVAYGMILLPLLPPLLEYLHFVWSLPALMATLIIIRSGSIKRTPAILIVAGFSGIALAGPFAEIVRLGRLSPIALAPFFALGIYVVYSWKILKKAGRKGENLSQSSDQVLNFSGDDSINR